MKSWLLVGIFQNHFKRPCARLSWAIRGWGMDLQHIETASIVKRKQNEGVLEELWSETLKTPTDQRLFYLREALALEVDIDKLYELTKIDKWFLYQLKRFIDFEKFFLKSLNKQKEQANIPETLLKMGKSLGYANEQIACLMVYEDYEQTVTELSRLEKGSDLFFKWVGDIRQKVKEAEKKIEKLCDVYKMYSVFKRVDTCAAEFESFTPYLYSTYEHECEAKPI